MPAHNQIDPILRKREVVLATGLSYSTIQRKHKLGEFPAPIRLGANSVGWKQSEIQAWLDSLERVEGAA